MGFSPLHSPFFGGGGGSVGEVPEPYHCAIGSHRYIVEPKKCHRQFISQLRPATQISDEPGEVSLNPENLWKRSASSWHEGAGQVWFDSAKEASTHRFRASKGMDVWTPFELTQLPRAGSEKRDSAATNGRLFYDQANARVWLVDGTSVRYSTNMSANAPTWAAATGLPGGTVGWAAFTGAHIYVVVGGAVYRCAVGSTVFASWYSATTVTGIQYANGRLFAWQANEIFELTAGAAKTTLFTHPQTTFTWDVVLGAPNATYMAGHLSWSSEIYRTDVRDATGALTAPVLSANVRNELVTAMELEGGYIILATKFVDGVGRIRLCQIVNPQFVTGGALNVGPDIFTELGQRPANPINALLSIGRFVYFSWMNLDSTCTGVGRMDLSTFTQPLVPAYATDQMAGLGAAHVQGAVLDIVWDPVSTQLWFVVSGDGTYGTKAATFMEENYLDVGRIRYGLLDTKIFAQMDMRCIPRASTMIHLTISLDDGSELAVLDCSGGADGPVSPMMIPHSSGEWAELRITMESDNAGVPPVLSWWVLFAIPVPGALEQIIMCLILRDDVAAGPSDQDVLVAFDVDAELDYLRSLVASRTIVTLQTGGKIEEVYVSNVEELPERWLRGNDHMLGLVNVEMKTLSA